MNLDEARQKVLGWDGPPTAGMSTRAISYRKPVRCIAFYRGSQISDNVLAWVLELATNGYITEAGMGLYLIPIKLYEQAKRDQQAKADEYARRRRKIEPNFKSGPASPSIKKWDCIPLTSFLPEYYCVTGPGNRRNHDSKVLIPMPLERDNRYASTLAKGSANRNGNRCPCGSSLAGKRHDAKYCSAKCRQAAYRSRAEA